MLLRNLSYINNKEFVFKIIESIADDDSIALRSCLIVGIHYLISYDKERAFKLYCKLTRDNNIQIIISNFHIIYMLGKDYLEIILKKLEFLLEVKDITTSYNVGTILMNFQYSGFNEIDSLLKKGIRVNQNIRKSVIEFSAKMLSNENQEIKDISERMFRESFSICEDEISNAYDISFTKMDLSGFSLKKELFIDYSKTQHVQKKSYHFIKYLLQIVDQYPDEVFCILENYKKFNGDVFIYGMIQEQIIDLIINIYNYSKNLTTKENAMNLFNNLLMDSNYRKRALRIIQNSDRL